MAVQNPVPTYTGVSPARTQNPTDFNNNMADWLSYTTTFAPSINTLAAEVNGFADSASISASNASSSASSAASSASSASASATAADDSEAQAQIYAAAAQAAAGAPSIDGKNGLPLVVKADGTGVEWGGVTTSPTDSTLGRLLKVGDYGNGRAYPSSSIVGVDFHTLPESTYFNSVSGKNGVFASSGATNTPPKGSFWWVEVLYLEGGSCRMIATTHNAFNTAGEKSSFFKDRVGGVGGTWTGWQEIYHTGNIVGTVSQSGGVPTGAIIERGSNANGEYVKYADGTLIARRRGSIGGGFASGGEVDRPWTFPATFSSFPTVSGFMYGGDSSGNGVAQLVKSLDTNSVVMRVKNNTLVDIGTLGANIEHCFAIGRWY